MSQKSQLRDLLQRGRHIEADHIIRTGLRHPALATGSGVDPSVGAELRYAFLRGASSRFDIRAVAPARIGQATRIEPFQRRTVSGQAI